MSHSCERKRERKEGEGGRRKEEGAIPFGGRKGWWGWWGEEGGGCLGCLLLPLFFFSLFLFFFSLLFFLSLVLVALWGPCLRSTEKGTSLFLFFHDRWRPFVYLPPKKRKQHHVIPFFFLTPIFLSPFSSPNQPHNHTTQPNPHIHPTSMRNPLRRTSLLPPSPLPKGAMRG